MAVRLKKNLEAIEAKKAKEQKLEKLKQKTFSELDDDDMELVLKEVAERLGLIKAS